ncbi:MAG: hypothetical protein Q8J69_07755 [Sphingobacteriaceae bacterium]|nr:hypothetical protein [Sphingobacteriaceae bacterium]
MSSKKTTTEGAEQSAPLTVEQLQEQLTATAQKLQEKETECNDLQSKNAELGKEVTDARETLKEMEDAIASAESKAVAKADEIVVDKVTYLVDPGNFKFEGEVVNANVLKENSKLAKKLIELGAGFIKIKGA